MIYCESMICTLPDPLVDFLENISYQFEIVYVLCRYEKNCFMIKSMYSIANKIIQYFLNPYNSLIFQKCFANCDMISTSSLYCLVDMSKRSFTEKMCS